MTITARIAFSAALIVLSFLLGLGAHFALEPALGTTPSATVGILVAVLGAMFAYLHWGFGAPVTRSLQLVGACGVGGLLVLVYHMVVQN